jgi:hypothetical protein
MKINKGWIEIANVVSNSVTISEVKSFDGNNFTFSVSVSGYTSSQIYGRPDCDKEFETFEEAEEYRLELLKQLGAIDDY